MLASFPYTQPELVPIRPQDESPLNLIEFEAKHPDIARHDRMVGTASGGGRLAIAGTVFGR